MEDVLSDIKKCPIIAAIRDIEKVDAALEKPLRCLFLLTGNILNIKYAVTHIKKAGKRAFVHLDLLEGISKDGMGIKYIAEEVKPDGIITTRGNLISSAKSEGIFTIQRVFILDSLAKDTAEKSINQVDPDAVEILPGVIPKIINKIHSEVHYPVIAGGLIETLDEVKAALKEGALAVSVSKEGLWDEIPYEDLEKRRKSSSGR
ncbi:MAG: glycerol uptake operon antiterminator [Thermoanaerobacteraceae bacterium]|nr:glycerol uptake operon antiterminator [Thermoanaerobacteraceae bacterium]MDN5312367.1 glycerol uptake operon antiterminator [Thermoanaerobacteraceae bacterium]RKL62606.1 glycerol-3-phosphate responsive antiterminator [Thermoanaerobacteraceae bacterium SP2]